MVKAHGVQIRTIHLFQQWIDILDQLKEKGIHTSRSEGIRFALLEGTYHGLFYQYDELEATEIGKTKNFTYGFGFFEFTQDNHSKEVRGYIYNYLMVCHAKWGTPTPTQFGLYGHQITMRKRRCKQAVVYKELKNITHPEMGFKLRYAFPLEGERS